MIIKGRVIRPERGKYVPKPKAVWPLTKSSIDEETGLFMDVSENEIPSSNGDSAVNEIGFEQYHAPIKLGQSPIFTGNDSSTQSFVILDYSSKILYWHGFSILFWIKIENETKTVDLPIMVSRRYKKSIEINPFYTLIESKEPLMTFLYYFSHHLDVIPKQEYKCK